MPLARGDVVLVQFPFSSGSGSKLRPALVVQSDKNNQRLKNVILAPLTTTTHRSGEATQYVVDAGTPVGKAAGVRHTSVVTCENLMTVEQSLISRRLGALPPPAMLEVDKCLKSALALA
ncbi:type II toxin-antitoxin system PemK/MazF family toxin [Aeoliella sp.]|uniref:type II toxin-antitoxin system PemK/MazF family toxin n=1 Tax=Aeoliella sp. TaxID=2795800 RepID=UPI003CCC4446